MLGWILKFFLPILTDLAIRVGLPAAADWIIKTIPWLAKYVDIGKLMELIADAISKIKVVKADEELGRLEKKVQVKLIRRQARRDCVGVACVPETKAI